MDDLQFRRSIYADPKTTDKDVRAAQQADPGKRKFAQDIEKLDQDILDALKVPVPEDLYDKLILRQTMSSHQQQKKKARIQLAMAASVAFVLGLTLNFMQFSSAYTNLGDYALAHVYHEAEYFSNQEAASVSLASLNQKMASFDGSFSTTMGELIAAEFCRFDSMKSLHLVFQGLNSPVNVFIIPKNKDLTFSADFSDSKLRGKSMAFDDADIIVVGDKYESLEKWQENINRNVQWST